MVHSISIYVQIVLCNPHSWVWKVCLFWWDFGFRVEALMCVLFNTALSSGGTSCCPLARRWHVPAPGLWGGMKPPLGSHPAGEAFVVGTMGTGTDQDVSQHQAEFLRSASHIHTHISSQSSGSNLSPRTCLVAGFPLILIHWHTLVKRVTNTVISNIYPVINANNRSNIPFSDPLSSNKGCN